MYKIGWNIHKNVIITVTFRWAQELIIFLTNRNLANSDSFCNTLNMRVVLNSLPNIKRFFLIEEKFLIADFKLSVEVNLLNSKILDVSLSRDTPISPIFIIKIYNSLDLLSISIVIPHTNGNNRLTSTFAVLMIFIVKLFLNISTIPLMKDFEWKSVDHCIDQILQVHPTLLTKTGIVHQETFCSKYDTSYLRIEEVSTKPYNESDFIVNFPNYKRDNACNKDITYLYNILKKQ